MKAAMAGTDVASGNPVPRNPIEWPAAVSAKDAVIRGCEARFWGIFKLVGWESEDRSERGNEAVIIGSDIATLISTTESMDVHGTTLNRRQPPGFPPRAGSGVTLCTKTELSKDTGHCKLCRKLPLKQGNFGGSFLSVFCTVL